MKIRYLNCLIRGIFLFGIILICPHLAKAESSDQVVRVGWFTLDGTQYINQEGKRSGYCYDYYQEIARYAGFRYEYVPGTWKECIGRLEKGEIDVLSFIQFSKDREKFLDFSTTQIGQNYAILTALSDNKEIEENDYNSFEGKTVAVTKGSSQIEHLKKYMKQNNFSLHMKEFDEIDQAIRALYAREADLLLDNSFRILTDNEQVVAQFEPKRIYLAVKKGNTKLLEKIDDALMKIQMYDPYLSIRLMNKYFNSNVGKSLNLTTEEKEYLESLGKITFGAVSNNGYLSYTKNGEIKGINPALVEKLAETLGIEYEYIQIDDNEKLLETLYNGTCDALCGIGIDYTWTESKDINTTTPYLTLQYYKIQNQNNQNVSKRPKIAVSKKSRFNVGYLLEDYGESQITWYDTEKECMQAVKKGRADITFCNIYTGEYYLADFLFNTLTSSLVNYKNEIGFATSRDRSPLLSTILNKGLACIGEDEINAMVYNIRQEDVSRQGLLKSIYGNPLETSICLCVLFGGIIWIVVLNYRYRVNVTKNKVLEKANAAKTSFLSNMSHEMRTPLNGIQGMLEALKEEEKLGDNSYLRKAMLSLNHLTTLINDILDMSKIESNALVLKPGLLSKEDFLNTMDAIIRPLAEEKNIEMITKVTGDCIKYKYIYADQERLKQVVINLLSNAIKYTQENGIVIFTIDSKEIEPDKVHMSLIVEDNGIGMSKEFLAVAFHQFEQEHRNNYVRGTGLGLAITKKIVELMDGTIHIESEPDCGTRVCVNFDAEAKKEDITDEAIKLHQKAKMPEEVFFPDKRALIAEDNEINMEIANHILSSMHIKTEMVENGAKAVQYFERSEVGYYDIIFMDIMMPEKDGLEATREIRNMDREDAKTVPIVAMTANAFVEDVHKSLKNGMNYHLSKPFQRSELKEIMIREFIGKKTE